MPPNNALTDEEIVRLTAEANKQIDAEIASKRSALKDQPLPTEVKNG